jgi:hypothetical protein
VLEKELRKVLQSESASIPIEFIEFALHCRPCRLRKAVVDKVNSLEGQVDAVFLGFGTCQALQEIESEVRLPVLLPPADDCIGLLLGPNRYRDELMRVAGTWFMTPGWCEEGVAGLLRALELERARRAGRDPLELARLLFASYSRVLFVDTGVGDRSNHEAQARDFAATFGLTFETTEGTLDYLREAFHAVTQSIQGV